MKKKRALVLAIVGFGMTVSVAVLATPAFMTISVGLGRGRLDVVHNFEIKFKENDAVDVVNGQVTTMPGGYSGWHSHNGPGFVVLRSGALTLYDNPACPGTVVTAGNAFYEKPGHTHQSVNESSVNAVTTFTFFLPPGVAVRNDEPAPEATTDCTEEHENNGHIEKFYR